MIKLIAFLLLIPATFANYMQIPLGGITAPGSAAPAPVTGMTFWFSADCISFPGSVCGVPADGTTLTTWADQSGNANTATNASGTCIFHTNRVNSKPSVTFSSCKMTLTTAVTGTNGHTAFVVFSSTATSGSNNHFIASNSGGFEYQLGSTTTAQNLTTAGVANIGTATNHITSGAWTQTNVFMTNAASTFAIGFRMASATDTTSSSSSTTISGDGPAAFGCFINGGVCSAPFVGEVAEIIYYNTTLTLTQIQQNEAYFRAKYGIS